MPDSKIEEVAKAMWFDFVDQHGYPNGMLTWDEMAVASEINDRREQFRSMAQAAVKAMRKPTEAMQTAAIAKIGYDVDWVGGLMGSPYSAGVQVLAAGYSAMIDAALSEEVAG